MDENMMGTFMKLVENAEKLEVPPDDERAQLDEYRKLHAEGYFCDDISGVTLDKELVIKARLTEMNFFKNMGVYTKVKKEKGMEIISTKWLDVNKGDKDKPNFRSRLVGRELNLYKRDDLFAGTPPLESLRFMASLCASSKSKLLMSTDVKRAYFYAPAVRPIYVIIPEEDRQPGDEDMVGQLNLSLYGTRDAALNWSEHYSKVLTGCCF